MLIEFHKNFGRSFVVMHVRFVDLVFSEASDTIPAQESKFTLAPGHYMHFLLSDLILFEPGLGVDLFVGLQVLAKAHFGILLLLFDTPWSQRDSLLTALLCEALDHIRKFGGNVRTSRTH